MRNCLFLLSVSGELALADQTFAQTKKKLVRLYTNIMPEQKTLYCSAPISWKDGRGSPDLEAVGYTTRKKHTHAHSISWSHVFPAYNLAGQGTRACWVSGGRSECEKKDGWFRKALADPHNLFPVIGEINIDRHNFSMSSWQSTEGAFYGRCKAKVDFKLRQFEPPNRVKGTVARVYLYMSDRYNLELSRAQRNLFEGWNRKFKAQHWECLRHKYIMAAFNVANSYVVQSCDRLSKDGREHHAGLFLPEAECKKNVWIN